MANSVNKRLEGLTLVVVKSFEITISDNKHCHNNCSFIESYEYENEYENKYKIWDEEPWKARCTLFKIEDLGWDKRYKWHGYKRCAECRKPEI